MNHRIAVIALLFLASCRALPLATRLDGLLPADAILLGEQHDAPEHQRIEREVIEALAARGQLAAVALEMAPDGRGTQALTRQASDEQVRAALNWSDQSWPWGNYGPVVMAAVRAGVPVLGANLPNAGMRAAMADASLDRQLPGPALKAQQQMIRLGHCGMLPETQIGPMARIQIARDQTMAARLGAAAQPGKVVLLLSGAAHADRQLGVPQHLPPALRIKVVRLQAGADGGAAGGGLPGSADAVWETPPVPPRDYCAELRKQ